MTQWQLFPDGAVPAHTTAAWYATRERAPHLEQDAHRDRLAAAARHVHNAAATYGLHTVSDLGAGDGGLLTLLQEPPVTECWGYDLTPANIRAARRERHVDVQLGDVVQGWRQGAADGPTVPIRWGEISVATEMLEHLLDPHALVRAVAGRSRVLVASSPWTERPGTAYEFHTWAWDQDGYRALLEQGGFDVVAHETCGVFQIVTGVAR